MIDEHVVHHYVARHVDEGRGPSVAFRSEDGTLTYEDVWRRVRMAAALVAEAGVRPGDRVVLLVPDSVAFVTLFWGAIHAGAIIVPVSTRLARDEYAHIVSDCRPTAVFAGSSHVAVLEEIAATGAEPVRVHVADDPAQVPPALVDPAVGPERVADPTPRGGPADAALIQYTSGSTGRPKGVVHLQRGLLALPRGFGRVLALAESDVCYSAAKMPFGYGLGNTLLFPMAAGASSILHAGNPDPYKVLDLLGRYDVTVFSAVPGLYSALLRTVSEDEALPASLRTCISAGEHLPEPLFRSWHERFGLEIRDGFGATELLHIVIANHAGDVRPGSTGRPVATCEVKLLDDAGERAAAGEIGRLYVRSPFNADRYWGKEALTKETMAGDGWTRTQDFLYEDADGYFFYVGRTDDVVKVGAVKVAPLEIEERLLSHPDVAECVVVARPGTDGLMMVVAFVRPAATATPDRGLQRSLKRFVRDALGPLKEPREVRFVDDFPRTSTGKVARQVLRESSDTQPERET